MTAILVARVAFFVVCTDPRVGAVHESRMHEPPPFSYAEVCSIATAALQDGSAISRDHRRALLLRRGFAQYLKARHSDSEVDALAATIADFEACIELAPRDPIARCLQLLTKTELAFQQPRGDANSILEREATKLSAEYPDCTSAKVMLGMTMYHNRSRDYERILELLGSSQPDDCTHQEAIVFKNVVYQSMRDLRGAIGNARQALLLPAGPDVRVANVLPSGCLAFRSR